MYSITVASALASDLQSVISGVKCKSTDNETEAADKKQCLAEDEEDIKPDINWTDYDDDWNHSFHLTQQFLFDFYLYFCFIDIL